MKREVTDMLPAIKYYPLAELKRSEDVFSDLFDRFFSDFFPVSQRKSGNGFMPVVDFADKKDHYLVKAELPGVKKEDLKVSLNDGVLSLSGEIKGKSEQEDDSFYHSERHYGAFNRAIRLPVDVKSSKVEAILKDGLLEVKLPKEKPVKAKEIEVKVAT
jgi:HSP20 family protein